MPAGAIGLLFIFNLLDLLALLKGLCQGEKKNPFGGNFDTLIIEDLLLLG